MYWKQNIIHTKGLMNVQSMGEAHVRALYTEVPDMSKGW